MKKSELKYLIKECVKELMSEVVPGRNRQYPSSELNVFNAICSTIVKKENFKRKKQSPDFQKTFDVYGLNDVFVIVDEKNDTKMIMSRELIVQKDKDDQLKYQHGDVNDLKSIIKNVIKEINGTPEYSHENYGMLESEGLDSELMKYTVSYKLYKNGSAIRDRKNVEVYGPDFGTSEMDKKKFLEDKVYSYEIASIESMKGKNKEIEPISGVRPTDSGDLKIVGLVVTSAQQTPQPADKSQAFDAQTIKKLSAPLPPGSRVD